MTPVNPKPLGTPTWTWRVLAFSMMLLGRRRYEIGREGRAYLTRWVIWGSRFSGNGSKVYLHYFWQSDEEAALHDHPWPFWSLVLWGGYFEVTRVLHPEHVGVFIDQRKYAKDRNGFWMHWNWYGPLSLLKRDAKWQHRVALSYKIRHPITLVWCGPKERSWGWWCKQGFVPHRQSDKFAELGLNVCGDER